jgi:RNA polymerase sigma factor (TIGR02999 family)
MPRRRETTDPSPQVPGREREPLDDLFAAAYNELRHIASSLKRHDGSVTLNPTALVNEAWLRLSDSPQLGALSPAHFKAVAARAMRRVLIDAARRRHARKRGAGSETVLIAFDEVADQRMIREEDVLGLDAALRDLARLDPRQAALVEYRYFGGLTVSELAVTLGVSETTVERDWRVAKAWLKSQLTRNRL